MADLFTTLVALQPTQPALHPPPREIAEAKGWPTPATIHFASLYRRLGEQQASTAVKES
jgi:hypothetical protein